MRLAVAARAVPGGRTVMKKQRGLSLIGLMVAGGVLFFLALLAMRAVPVYLEYFKVRTAIQALAASGSTSAADLRNAFDKRADLDDIEGVRGEDLDIQRVGAGVVISVRYSRKVPLMAHASLLFDFDIRSTP
jgi:hypothetical protein